MKYLYFYAGIIPGSINHEYVSGTLSLESKLSNNEEYEEVLRALEETYGNNYSMLNFNFIGNSDE